MIIRIINFQQQQQQQQQMRKGYRMEKTAVQCGGGGVIYGQTLTSAPHHSRLVFCLLIIEASDCWLQVLAPQP